MTNDMTVGKPVSSILKMALPVMLGNLFQQFYSMADTMIVGRCLGRNALAAVGATSSIYSLILWFSTGCTGGFAIILAQKFGAGRYDALRKKLALSILLSSAITVIVTFFSLLSLGGILRLMHTPSEILPDAESYIFIILAGLFATIAYNMSASVLRAMGDGKTPLYFLILTSFLNIFLDLMFIQVFHMGTGGAAAATVLSQAVSALLCVLYMRSHFPILHLRRDDWKQTAADAADMLRLGLPMGLMGAVTASGIIILQFAINSFGTAAVAAYTSAARVEQVFEQILGAFSVTMSNYCGQNYGAGKTDRIRKGVRESWLLMFAAAVLFILIVETAGGFILGQFLSQKDASVISMATEYLRIVALFLPAFGTIMIFRSSIQGMGNASVPMLNGIIESACRALWTLYLIRFGTFHQLCLVNPTAWTIASVILIIIYRRHMRKLTQISQISS